MTSQRGFDANFYNILTTQIFVRFLISHHLLWWRNMPSQNTSTMSTTSAGDSLHLPMPILLLRSSWATPTQLNGQFVVYMDEKYNNLVCSLVLLEWDKYDIWLSLMDVQFLPCTWCRFWSALPLKVTVHVSPSIKCAHKRLTTRYDGKIVKCISTITELVVVWSVCSTIILCSWLYVQWIRGFLWPQLLMQCFTLVPQMLQGM